MPEASHETLGEARPGRWLVTCDHAGNAVPGWIGGGSLGLTPADMARHIAWDPGAAGVTRALAEALDSPAVLATFSRLVIDPNRGEDDPTLIMQVSDGTVIEGNRGLSAEGRAERLARLYHPYHAACTRLAARRPDTAICAVHSFTPQLRGRPPRPWQVGILHSPRDSRLALALIARLGGERDLCVGDNEPYAGHLPGDAIDRHALAHGRPNVLVELRQDLIATPADQAAWAARLAPILVSVLQESGL
jgi:predicted N-formylglutamate amidohydrolase